MKLIIMAVALILTATPLTAQETPETPATGGLAQHHRHAGTPGRRSRQ